MRETVAGNDVTVGEAQITWSPIAHFSFYSEQPGEPRKVFESRGDIIPVFRIDKKRTRAHVGRPGGRSDSSPGEGG